MQDRFIALTRLAMILLETIDAEPGIAADGHFPAYEKIMSRKEFDWMVCRLEKANLIEIAETQLGNGPNFKALYPSLSYLAFKK